MNQLSTSSSDIPGSGTTEAGSPAQGTTRSRGTWLLSLTAVCFIFGGLLAMQLRAAQKVHQMQEDRATGLAEAQEKTVQMKKQLDRETVERAVLQKRLAHLQGQLAKGQSLTQRQVLLLNAQIKELQVVACLTRLSGPGVSVRLSDNPEVAKAGGGSNPFLPGVVHDYDLVQTVNELRAAKAEAISVNGTRITSYTPIRCVGPTILINFEAATPPFIIEAIGDPDRLQSALTMPSGILDRLKNEAGLEVSVKKVGRLQLTAATEGVPRLRLAHPPSAKKGSDTPR